MRDDDEFFEAVLREIETTTEPQVLAAVSTALGVAGEHRLADALRSLSMSGVNPLARIRLRLWLQARAAGEEGKALVAALADVDRPPWPPIRAALVALRAEAKREATAAP
jgi:hypothetical protein